MSTGSKALALRCSGSASDRSSACRRWVAPGAPETGAASAAQTAAPAQAGGASSTVEELKQYKALLDAGVLTEEEFAAKKRQLLGI